jgi:predicted nucleotide-binding protein
MEKTKEYPRAKFPAEVLVAAKNALQLTNRRMLSVEANGSTWNHDSESEFCADYRQSKGPAHWVWDGGPRELTVRLFSSGTHVTVKAESRELIESTFELFEQKVAASTRPLPPPPPPAPNPKPRIFIGHGHSGAWRDLKDYLQDKQGHVVVAYEVGARAGYTVRDVLETMLKQSTFALLVLTGEDEMGDGSLRARQNVIHEAGLFQGRLGFARAVVLLEEGVEPFSNVAGVEHITFGKGRIKESYGEVLATLKREFPG